VQPVARDGLADRNEPDRHLDSPEPADRREALADAT
jgi:hypothetical protein